MVKLIGRLLGGVVQLALLPFAILFAIPMGIMKARRAQEARLLFTRDEQSLLGKAQRTINMDRGGLLSPDRDLLTVAACIEKSRIEYQLIKRRERYDPTFSEFVAPGIMQCHVSDWGNAINFFNLVDLGFHESSQGVQSSPRAGKSHYDYEDDDIPL